MCFQWRGHQCFVWCWGIFWRSLLCNFKSCKYLCKCSLSFIWVVAVQKQTKTFLRDWLDNFTVLKFIFSCGYLLWNGSFCISISSYKIGCCLYSMIEYVANQFDSTKGRARKVVQVLRETTRSERTFWNIF